MDRARSSHFVWHLPRNAIDLVHEQEQIEDKQLLLNESWQHYCDRYDGGHEVPFMHVVSGSVPYVHCCFVA